MLSSSAIDNERSRLSMGLLISRVVNSRSQRGVSLVRNLHQPTWKTGKIGSPSGISSDLASLFCRFWQNFLDEEAREFTTVEACRPLLEPCFQPAMVVLLMLSGQLLMFEGIYQLLHDVRASLGAGGNWAECSTESASIIELWAQGSIKQ
jgi:hypothetical protein